MDGLDGILAEEVEGAVELEAGKPFRLEGDGDLVALAVPSMGWSWACLSINARL